MVVAFEPKRNGKVLDSSSALDNQVTIIVSRLNGVNLDIDSVEISSSLKFNVISPNTFASHVLAVFTVRSSTSQRLFVFLTTAEQLVDNIVPYLHVHGFILEQQVSNGPEHAVSILGDVSVAESLSLHLSNEISISFLLYGGLLYNLTSSGRERKLLNHVKALLNHLFVSFNGRLLDSIFR